MPGVVRDHPFNDFYKKRRGDSWLESCNEEIFLLSRGQIIADLRKSGMLPQPTKGGTDKLLQQWPLSSSDGFCNLGCILVLLTKGLPLTPHKCILYISGWQQLKLVHINQIRQNHANPDLWCCRKCDSPKPVPNRDDLVSKVGGKLVTANHRRQFPGGDISDESDHSPPGKGPLNGFLQIQW